MANITIEWAESNPISIRSYARDCGFNLGILNLNELSDTYRNWIIEKVVNYILEDLDETWDEFCEENKRDIELRKVTQGIYIVSLAGSICIGYPNEESQVIYVGQGKIRERIKAHLKNWVAHLSESLQDMEFNIYMTEVKVPGFAEAYKDVEYDILEEFRERYGQLPIQNSISGRYSEREHEYNKKAFYPIWRNRNINKGWKIEPMPDNDWFVPVDED